MDTFQMSMNANNNKFDTDIVDYKLKVVVLGEQSCGKSSIVTRYCQNDFNRQYYPTLGVDFSLRRISLHNRRNVRVHFWDVGGQALSSTLLQLYLYSANVIILAYDVTNNISFTKLNDWLNIIKSYHFEKFPTIAVIGNKCDMEHQRAVSMERQTRFANENNIVSHSVSARTGENVGVSIQRVCAEALGFKLSKQEQEAQQSIVTAEIINLPSQVQPTYQPTSSAICCIQ